VRENRPCPKFAEILVMLDQEVFHLRDATLAAQQSKESGL
jgi:hypothetical protein